MRFAPTPTVPKSIAFASVTCAWFPPPLLLKLTAPVKSFVASVRVIAFAPAVKLDVVDAVIAPVWVIAPPAVTARAAVAVVAARSIALVSSKVTVEPVTPIAAKLFAGSFKITVLPALLIVVAPPATIVPLSETAPPAVTCKVPVVVTAAKMMSSTSVTAKFVTAPFTSKVPKSFDSFKVIALVPASNVAVWPSFVITPLCVIAPPLVTPKAPVAVIPAITVAVVSARVTAAPVKVTAPVTSFPPAPLKSTV